MLRSETRDPRQRTSRTASPPIACAHCGEPVPAGLVDAHAERQFCCNGCQAVYDVIHRSGLERYYALKRNNDAGDFPAKITRRRFGEFDDPTFRRLYVREIGGGLASVELFLPAVHCAACVWLVEKLPTVCDGVIEARLDLRRALVRITWNEGVVTLSQIARALDSMGYAPTPARSAGMRAARQIEDRRQMVRLGVAGACAGNVMLLALALYSGMFDAIDAPYLHLFRWVSMGISLVSLAWPGRVFFIGALNALRTRTLHLDLPIAIGLGAGAIWGVVSTVRGSGEIYFDSLSVLVFALLLGRFMQTRQQRWTADSIELLYSLTPTSARVVADVWDESASEVPIEAVSPGMIVEALAGDSIPVDGVIVRGASQVDQSMLTGESRPVDVREGMGVAAGAVNLSATLRVRVEATGEATRVGRLMKMVEEASLRRAPVVRAADRMAGWFVTVMLLLAAATLGVWLWKAPSQAVDHAVALLIVTCPCALGLATPLAVTVAVGRAARRGMLVKGGDALERLAKPGVIFLDKTGTITHGRLSVIQWIGDGDVRPLIAAVEAHSSHPVAQALMRDVPNRQEVNVTSFGQTIGGGVEAVVNGWQMVIGSPVFVRGRAARVTAACENAERLLLEQGLSPILIAMDGEVIAAAGLGDPIREGALQAIDALRRGGWDVRILSGDHQEIVCRVGQSLRLVVENCRGGVSPEGKLLAIREALQRGVPVVMAGDGVNDAAALAAATVGIAVHGGAEASLAAADVYLNRAGLQPIVDLIEASRRTMHVIRRNFALSLFYNVLAAALAIAGVINPLIAALLMPASSLTVVTSSFRARTFQREDRRCR